MSPCPLVAQDAIYGRHFILAVVAAAASKTTRIKYAIIVISFFHLLIRHGRCRSTPFFVLTLCVCVCVLYVGTSSFHALGYCRYPRGFKWLYCTSFHLVRCINDTIHTCFFDAFFELHMKEYVDAQHLVSWWIDPGPPLTPNIIPTLHVHDMYE